MNEKVVLILVDGIALHLKGMAF